MMRKEFLASSMNQEKGLETKHMAPIDVAPQYSNSVKIEGTRDGPRATVHAYGDVEEETRQRAVRLYKLTLEDLEKEGFRTS